VLIRNTTPFFHAATVTARKPPQLEMMLVVRGTFKLVDGGVIEAIEDIEQGFLCGDLYEDEDEERSGALLYASDFADFKLNAEVLLIGSCHPPGGKPTVGCPVRLSVGDWSKSLMVHGNREWERGVGGLKPGKAEPFESMPIDYSRAFGGPDHPPNPVGKGYGDDPRVPNIELVKEVIQYRDQVPTPASFAPINSAWPQRAKYQGKQYDRDYRKNRAPFYSVDHNWHIFSAAPADQQLKGYLRGDEDLSLQNLHPDCAVLNTKLPGMRLRAFVKDETGQVRSMTLSLDTLLCEPDEGLVKLTWRGLMDVVDDELEDVTHIYIASEQLDQNPLPDAHYITELEAFEADPTGVLAGVPAPMMEEYERMQKERRGEPVPERELDPSLDPISGALKQKMGAMIDDDTLAQIGETVGKMKEAAPEKLAEVEEALAKRPATPKEAPPMRVLKPGRMPDMGLKKKMRVVMEQVAAMRKAAADAEAVTETDQKIQGLDKLEQLEAMPHNPKWKELDPEYEVPEPLSDDPPGPGADLSERDFSEQDLTGVDLSGANLERTNFTAAKLAGANLSGANLRHAQLHLTDLAGANLRGANLELANAIAVRAPDADFTDANINEACFEAAFMPGAKLNGAKGEYLIFELADLSGVQAEGAHLDHSDFSGAKLAGAKLRATSLVLCLFAECAARGVDLTETKLERASFVDADVREASFIRAIAHKCFLMRARLDRADFGYADLTEAQLIKASAKATRFYGTNLREARLDRANLEAAQLVSANLMSGELYKARVEGTNFAKSNLYDAKLQAIRGKGFDLTGANLERAVFEEA